eukprot:CAMPEP_0179625450 /NCGR_PEP_ID=MMETSP0932-20121108/3297_1 /TAXON_ID=548131 ORGANISM="Ostreococcus mediterraneus, Strain clade-D-RCC2596" /NCGR_SAMPLE_ID=MMETSP0932 /ASSEMBLY_ACC=CAM_ASM_000582 /LENGTH=497 /DNA_ID=CAMNT_0021494697 /DNA_START=43 /DNA_END=1532 /DNA_ORIENTATION=-
MSARAARATREDVERRVQALRAEIASRDAMLEAVQAQTRMDVEHARRERDDALEALRKEKRARDDALEALCATNAVNAAMKEELEALKAREGATSASEAEAREALAEATARLSAAESACEHANVKCGGEAFVAPTPGRSPSAVPLKKKVAMLEARARDDFARRKEELERFLTREKARHHNLGRHELASSTTVSMAMTITGDVAASPASARESLTRDESDVDAASPASAASARDVTLAWGIARSEALDCILELVERACVVLERSAGKVRVREADVVDVEDDDEDVEPRSWEDVARDLRDPDAALESLTQWIDECNSGENHVEHHDVMIRVSSAVHHAIFALKRSAGAAAASARETREALALADEASQMFRLRLAQAETTAKLALSRATAAEDANETISRLASDARREADASAKIADAARRDLKRRESELAIRELSSKLSIDGSLTMPYSPSPSSHRPMAPFPTPDAATRSRRAADNNRSVGENLSPALRELQNLRRAL